MATPMLRARQALRIIDKFERVTAESRRTTHDQTTAGGAETDLESNSRGLNNSLPERSRSGSLEPVQESGGERTLERPPSHTAVDIPDLATRDSATVSSSITLVGTQHDNKLDCCHQAYLCTICVQAGCSSAPQAHS